MRSKFQPSLAFNFPEFIHTFPDEKNAAYHAGASKSVVQREIVGISGEQPVFTSTRPLSQLTQSQTRAMGSTSPTGSVSSSSRRTQRCGRLIQRPRWRFTERTGAPARLVIG